MLKKLFVICTILVILFISTEVLSYFSTEPSVDIDHITVTPTPQKGYIEMSPVNKQQENNPEAPYDTTSETTTIDSQTVVVYRPVNQDVIQSLVVYSHGSNEHVEPSIVPGEFADALPQYGGYFASQGAVFAASELMGENWGDSASQVHLLTLIDYYKTQYPIINKVYVYGFSMGGLTALRTTKRAPEVIDKVALLAPTIHMDDWNSASLHTISSTPIKIWHGTADVNVPISLSQEFLSRIENAGLTNVILVEISNETHRHLLNAEEIWQFFTES